MASHTLNDEEYGGLITARKNAELRAAELEAELAAARLEDPANRIAPLTKLARAMIEITRFAVANLTPETTKGWPTKALFSVADLIPTLPDLTADDRDLANEFRAFARDAETYSLMRDKQREEKLAKERADVEAEASNGA